MAGSAMQFTYGLGVTQFAVPAGAPVQVIPPRACNGLYFGWLSGGSLTVCPSAGSTLGFLLGTTERIPIDGPATFYLCAAGSTAVAGIIFKFSSGYSLQP